MKRNKATAIGLVFVLAMLMVGCPKDPYTASMAGSDDIANGVADGITIIADLQKAGLMSPTEVSQYAGYLGSLTTLNQTYRASVRQIHSSGVTGKGSYLSAAQTFVTNANNPQLLAALHVSNPSAQAKVQTFMVAISTALTGIQTAITAAKGA